MDAPEEMIMGRRGALVRAASHIVLPMGGSSCCSGRWRLRRPPSLIRVLFSDMTLQVACAV